MAGGSNRKTKFEEKNAQTEDVNGMQTFLCDIYDTVRKLQLQYMYEIEETIP